jgi:hypothetical protein
MKEEKSAQARDLLMLSHGWRKFTWEQIQNLLITLKYDAEKRLLRIRKKIGMEK